MGRYSKILSVIMACFMVMTTIAFMPDFAAERAYANSETQSGESSDEWTGEWELNQTSINAVLSDGSVELYVSNYYSDNEFTWTSSNSEVVSVTEKRQGSNVMLLKYESIGAATITVTDKEGKQATCEITVEPDPFILDSANVVLQEYDDTYGDDYNIRCVGEGDNVITSVKSSDPKVATVNIEREEDAPLIAVTPVASGTTIITAEDQYGQKAEVSFSVTQKYIDELKYLEELWESTVNNDAGIKYGETGFYCTCDISANVYALINGEKYVGKIDDEGDYVIKGIPKLPVGTKIEIVFQKGLAKYTIIEKIGLRPGHWTDATVKPQTYTGKKLEPKVVVKDEGKTLKEGRDYTVTYPNNINVGDGKVILKFDGNYKGTITVYFDINPKPTKLKKVKPMKKGFKVTWKKQTKQTTGYQIQYSTNKKFKKGKKLITIKKKKTTSKKIKKLKANKKYYVRVRTYKVVDGYKYYSKWSPAKTVKTKR